MRETLSNYNNERHTFTATVSKFSERLTYTKSSVFQTIHLDNVRFSNGKMVANEVWLYTGQQFKDANLSIGDNIQFKASVRSYYTHNDDYDYKLNYPTKIIKLN